jgi:WD40 repeat protein
MRVSKDGSTVALSLADDRLLELSPNGETLRSQAVAGGYALALSPDGKTFALSGHKCALVVKAGEAHELDGHAARVERAVFSRDGLFVAVQGEDTDVVSLLDGSRRERVGVTCLSTGVRKSEFLAAMGPTAVVWDAARGDVTERIRTVSAPRPYARIWRSPDGRLLAISEPFSTPDVYADGSEEPLELPDGLFGTVLGLEFSPDGKHFAVSTVSGNHGESGRLLILTPELKHVFELRTDGAVCPAAWHPDGQSLVWSDLESTTFLRFPSCEKIASEDVVQNWWRFRSASALVSGGSREVQVRHARTRVRAATLPVPDGCAWTVASPDGLRVAAAESDRVRVFRIELEGE